MIDQTIPKPLFSIITVTLNPGENNLVETVNSVLQQDCKDWELIIKDGGSTDNSLSTLPGDARIRVFHEKDSGIFDAMNQALKLASGEFICFLNSGDSFIDVSALSSVVKAHRNHPEADFLYGDVHKPQSRSGYEFYPSNLSRFYLFKHMICHQSWFIRKGYYELAGDYETTSPSGSDYRYLLRMILRDHVDYKHVPKVLINYKGGGFSQQPEVLRIANSWIDKQRLELFRTGEYSMFSLIWYCQDFLKKVIYDCHLYKVWRKIQQYRAKKR